tara:strand:+ start:176 stop:541 length:366 start_codon:yes stop_codon:yes gene_type:complete
MALIWITLNFNDINISLQVGDIVYYTYNGQETGGFDKAYLPNTRKLGKVISINHTTNSIVVEYDDNLTYPPPIGAYISFVKDKTANTSSLLGYYAEVQFVNDSKKEIELFTVGSEISQSSN